MSYQKSVALLSCAFLFSALAPESTKAFTSEAPKWESHEVVERSLTSELNAESFLTHPKSNAVSPPDTEGPVITATAPADVTLYGCYDDLTFSGGAMGKPTYSVYDDCGSAAVTETYSDSFAFCAQADDSTPEGGLVITRTFTIVAEDCYENTTTVNLVQIITVVDNNLPSFVEALPGDTTVDCASVPSAPVLTATDTCDSDVSVSFTELATNDCSGIIRTWVAVDDCGNSITYTQNITVTDTTDPVITGTPSDIALNNDAANCGAQVTWTAPTATDNCALKSLESDHASGDTFPVGTTLVTYTATDSCGNTATTSFNVVITDAEDPVLVGVPSDIAQGNDLDSCGAIVTWTLPTSSDNCSGDTLVGSHAPGDYFALGQTTVTYTATDSVGNDTTSTFVVTISDEQKPAIDGLPSDISVLAGADSCGTVVNWTAPTSLDNCSVTSFAPSSPSGSVFAVGTHTISYTASDAAGNDSIASFDIVVADAENPVISDMPEDITITAEADSCSAIVTWQGATADDNCDMQSLTSDYSSGDRFPVGATLVTYTALDIHGNDTTATFTITVTDDQSPSLIGMPSDITQTMDQDSCGAVVSWTPPTVDENCSQTLTASHNPGDYFPAGPTTVTYISMDPSGGGDTASFTITTTDDEAPVILNTPTDFGVDSDAGVCTAVVNWTPPTAADNCGQTMTSTHNPGDTFESGETVVSYVSVDAAGNQDSTAFTITVSDNEAPVLTAMAMDTTSECSGLTDTTDLDAWLANHGGATATDNCDSLAWTHNYAGDCTVEVGDFNTHQQGGWGSTSGGVHDNLNNNFDAIFPSGVTVGCSAGYEIVFTTADAIETYLPCTGDAESLVISHSGPNPEASSDPTCWNNALVSQILTAKLNAQFDANLPAFSSSDLLLGDLVATSGVFMGMSANDIIAVADSIVGDCSTSYTLNEIRAVLNDFNRNYAGSQVDEGLFAPAACFYGDCGGTGSVTVTFTATDEAGNTSSTTASFTSVDTTPPTISAQDYTLYLDSTGAATLTAANVDLGTADACGFDTLTLSQTAFDCSHLGDVTVTLTALDDCGNSSTEDVTISVTDTIAPSIDDFADITEDSDAGVCTGVVSWSDPGTWDNCTGETLSYSHASGSTFEPGLTTVTITVTDLSQNQDSITFDVTIEDNEVPTIAAMSDLNAETTATTCDATVTWTDPAISDNCPGDTLTYSHDPGSTFGLGTTTVTAYVTDAAMNTDSVKFDVVVVDATDPVINGMPADTTISNDLDACEAVYNWTAPSAADNCELDTLYADYDSGDSFPLGATVVTYTALDETGNDSLATFTITVEDNQAPTIASLPDTTLSSELSSCSAVYTWLNPATSDNCPGETISSSHPSGTAFPVGSTTVTLTVTDASLNSDSTSFVVTVLDKENPVIAPMSDITVNTAPGLCTQTVSWTAPAVTDNCALDTLTCSHTPGASFTAAGSGQTTITYTALDSSGNTATETFKIIVIDNELPVMTAASDTTLECAENNGVAFGAWLANYGGATATDNCTGDLTWTNDHDDDAEPSWICGYTTSITVTFTATDESLNSSTTTATFNVEDTTDPVFDQTLPGDTTVNCESVPAAVTLTAQDACSDEVSVTYVPDTVPGVCPHEYTINRTWSTTDDCGNSATHTQVITVQDTVAPIIAVQAMDSTLACDGTDHSADFASWRAAYGGATATETCGDITWTESYVMGSTCAGDSAEVTFTATDECGNFSTTTAIWKMEDVTAPVLVTPAENDTVECDGAGNTAAIMAWLSSNAGATATEECSGLKWSNDFTTMGMTCGNTSAVQVVFTATDSCQNATQTIATFVIEDTTPPSFVEALPADGTFECNAVPTAETLTATDICGGSMPVTYNQQRVDSICPDTYRLMRTWTTADSCGNTASHTQKLIIEDTTAPLVVAKDFTIYLDDNGSATLVADSLDNGSSDNCSTPFFSADNTTFYCGNLGGNPVLLTASDSCLNTASATVQVTVLDTISPVFVDEIGSPALAEDKTVECDGTDYTSDLNNWIANHGGAEADDNCDTPSWSNSAVNFVAGCGNSGSYTITFTATDGSGNSSSTTATYYINDTTAPVISSPATNVTVECNGSGNIEDLTSWVEANGGAGPATDACGDVTWSNNFAGFGATCSGSSAVEVTFYATDDCGNVASTSSIFTIEDTTAPELTTAAADTTVECDGAGNTAALSAWLSNNGGAIADEICGDVTWSFSPGDLGGTSEFVYAMGHEDWGYNDDAPEGGYSSFYRYDYNADGSISNPQLMFRLDEFDEDLIDNYYFSGYDRNPVTGTDYFVVGDGPRALLTYDIESDVVTDTGIEWDGDQNYGPDAFAFSNDGTCYAWINYSDSPSEIQTVNLSTGAMETFITVNQGGGAKALTYDFDNNRLLLASRGNGGASHKLGAVDLATGDYTLLHNIAAEPSNTEENSYTTIMGLEYIGNGMCLVSGGWRGHDFGQLDVAAGTINYTVDDTYLVNPDQPALKRLFVPISAGLPALSDACAESGDLEVTFTATDGCGNTVVSTAMFIVTDTTSPTALAQDVTVYLDANGLASITTADVDNGSSDDCGDVTMALDVTSFDCDDVGPNPVVLTVWDACMNADSATITVNVTALDSLAPNVANLPADTTLTADSGMCTAVVNFAMPTIDDNCDGGSLTSSHNTGDAFPVGTTTVTFVVEDASQNTDSTTFDITVTDDELPKFTGVPNNISVNSDLGVCTAAPTWAGPSVTDNCGIETLISTHDSGDTFQLGTTTVTYTATDIHGNVDSVSFTVEVTDAEKPAIAGLPADIAQGNDLGDCTAAVTWTLPTASDNCELDTLISSHQSGDVFPLGATVVTYTATDAAGNDSIATFTVTISDTEKPGIENLPSDITQTNDEDVCGAVVTWEGFDITTDSYINVEESDNCPGANISSTHNSGDTFPVGVTTVTYTANDAAGNDSIASFTVTITDDQKPAIDGLPADFSQTADADSCGAIVSWTPPTGSDNCTGDTLATSHEVGSYFPVGTTTVTYTATDSVGNDSIASFVITVTDDQAPAILGLPGDLSASNDLDSCGAIMTWSAPSAADNCTVDTLYSSHASGEHFPVGVTTVTYTAVDIYSNSTDSTFTVTVTDDQDPAITAASDTTVECNGTGNTEELNAWLANHGGATATDNCDAVTITNDYDTAVMADSCGMTGTVLVTFTATDGSGNTSTTNATFIIQDTTPPTFEPYGSSEVVECDGSGNADELTAWFDIWNNGITVTDNCGGVSVSKTSTLLTNECGATGEASVTFVATDACGNQTDTTLTFTIEDTTPPTLLTTAQDSTVECDGAGNQDAFDAWLASHGGATAEDVCGNYTWSNNFIALSDDCGATGSASVTFSATDECGNTSTTTATFTIEDTTDPAIASEAIDLTVECDGAGNAADLNGWLSSNGGAGAASDACGSISWSNDFAALSDDCGATGSATVTFTVTDECGLTSSTTATFTIEDTTDPSIDIASADLTVECDGAGNAIDLNNWLSSHGGASASDLCSDPMMNPVAINVSSLFEAGPNGTWPHVVTLTTNADPTSGNQQALEINVTSLPSGGATYRVVKTVANGNWFQANPQPLVLGINTLTVSGVAFQRNVKVQFSDGEVEFDSLVINGEEQMSATLTTGTSDLFAPGPNATWTHVLTATTTADPNSGDQQTVEINVTEMPSGGANYRVAKTVANGNWFFGNAQALSLGSNTITVNGVAFQRSVKIQVSSADIGFDSLVLNGGEQVTGGVSWSNDFTALSDDCGATGSATVTFTATDACGNTSTTSAIFTIEDTVDPAIASEAQDLTVECDGAGNPTDLANWLNANGNAGAAFDACGDVVWSNDFSALSDDCGATGAATVIFTATDECGNTSTTSATFTIEDTTDPILSGDEVVIIDCAQWPWEALYQPTIDELLTVVDTAGNPMITLDESCGYTNFPIDFGVMSGGCSYDHQLIYYPVDACGNTGDSLYQVIQVDDFSEPVFTHVPADTMIACTENVMVYLEMATAIDACDPSVDMTFQDEVIPTACPEEFTIRRTFYAEDCGYNIAEAVQTITVADTAAPSLALTAPSDTVFYGCLSSADLSIEATGTVTWVESDDCGEVTVTFTTTDVSTYTCNADDAVEEGSYLVTRTFTVTAVDCAGNSTTKTVDQVITITDNEVPMATLTAPADTTIYLDETCFASDVAHPVSGDATGFLVDASDNCDSEVAHTIVHEDDTTYTGIADGVGSFDILRTYTVTLVDDCGNDTTETTSHMIHVMDTIHPATYTDFPNDTIIYADDSNGYFDPTPSSTGGPSVDYSDNCSGSGESQYGAIGQSVPTGGLIITAIGDPNDAASSCRFVEIHNSSDADIDMSGYALQRWTNGSATPSTGNNVDLSPLGTLEPGQYAHISNSAGFEGCYGFASNIVGGGSGPVGSNGDDNIAIINSSSDIIDLFGVIGEDGSNTCHDFEDGVALRAGTNTDPNGGAWDEAGWIVYSDFSNASGCTNHNSSQQQNAADIAPLLNNWAGAGEAPVETDFNDADISFSDETISYTASACYTFERTWTVTVTDNNGNATISSAVQTIAVSDTTAPVITADAETTAACDFFGFDLSAGDESTLLAGTSFEQASTGSQYTDTGDPGTDHALVNNPGQADVNFTAANGEMGFTSYFYTTGSGGLSNDFTGVSSYTGTVDAFTDGAQGFQMTDVDGRMELTFDEVDVSDGGVTLSIDAFIQSTGWEDADLVRIWVVADGGEVDLLNTTGQDIDNLGIEDQWITYTLDLDGYDSAELHVSLASNSGSETLYIDNISFSQGNSPMAALMANGYVSFSDNVELATTGASITLDGSPCEGAYDIVYSATDSCGNASSMSQRIELVDTVDPVLLVAEPADTVIYADADCFADYIDGVPYPAASATDNCDEDVEITAYHVDSPKQYACLPGTGAFTLQRTYTTTATDNCGNEHTVQVNRLVTVLDTISPTFNVSAPAALFVNIDPFCGANTSTTIGGEPTVSDAADNCDSDVAIEITHVDSTPVYTCSDADGQAEGSYTFVRTFTVTATDDCGNQTVKTVTQDVTATDVTSPVITAVPPMAEEVINLDADCFADLSPTAMPLASASDACDTDVSITSTYTDGAPTYTCSNADGEAEGSFTFTRTWTVTATDDCNNSNSQQTTQTVTVLDGLAPTLTPTWPEDHTADLDENCDADLSPSMTGMATATSEDACDSEVSVSISHADHDTTLLAVNVDALAEGGFTFIRTWTVVGTDDCGNETTATHDQVITAYDVLAPSQTLETLPTYTVEGCYGDVDLSPATTGTPMVTAEDACDSELDIDLTHSTDDLAFNEVMGDYSLVIDTISGPEEGIIGSTTVRIYIETENEGDFISAVAGDIVNPTGIRTTTSFYQNALGSNTANSLSDLLLAADPMLAYDSWVTIGIEEAPNSGDGEVETSTIGDWSAAFAAGEDLLISDFFGGSWYTIFPNTAAVAGDDHRVLLGQFTTDGQMSGQLFVQVFPNGVGADEQRMSFTFGDCAEDDDTPEGSYSFTRRWESVVTDDANNQDTAVSYQHIMVLDTEAPQLTNTCDIVNGETVAYDCPGEGVLDFDPVPVACDVTAMDNCDSEVNVNLFTETTGYIPTNDIRNYCAPMTPEAQSGNQTCDDRAPESMRLFNFPGLDDSFVLADGESLVQVMSDGSLEISMEMENGDGTGGFTMTASYGVGQDWTTWQAGGSNYKKDCAEIYPGEAVWEDWVYFLMTEGSLEGTGMYAGSSFSLSHQPANGYYGLQMGLGANNKNSNYGGSAWFFWQGNLFMNGTDMGPMASSGDFYMDLDCCLEWQVDYFYTALDDCGNPTGFSYSEAMGTDLDGGGADVSGGHTGGPVDITNVGGIKEPIRITGLAPNPTDNQSQLTFLVNQNMRLRVDLYTMEGLLVQELYEGNAVTGVQYMMDIDADQLAAGMYQVRVSSNVYLAVKKLLVAD